MPTSQTPFNQSLYTGRTDNFESDKAKYWYHLIKAYSTQTPQTSNPQKIGLVGFACDQGVNRNQGRIGAKHAPDAIRAALAKLPVSLVLQRKYPSQTQLNQLVGDCGNVVCEDNDTITPDLLESAQQAYADKIAELVANDKFAIGIGGGHEIAWASFLGLYQGLKNGFDQNKTQFPTIGIINFDPHFDIRQDQYASSGTPFRQIAEHLQQNEQKFNYLCVGISQFSNTASLFERAENFGIQWISDDDCYRLDWQMIEGRLTAFIEPLDVLYVTVDMDCLQASVMPAVSAVAAKGLPLDFVERCLVLLLNSGKVKVLDMAEINPQYDRDGVGLKVAGRMLAGVIEQVLL